MDAVVCERDFAMLKFGKVLLNFLIGISAVVVGMREGIQKIILDSQASQNSVAQSDTICRIQVGEGRVGLLRIHRHSGKHLIHAYLHEAYDQFLTIEAEVCRHCNYHRFICLIQVFDGYLRLRNSAVVKAILIYIVLSTL